MAKQNLKSRNRSFQDLFWDFIKEIILTVTIPVFIFIIFKRVDILQVNTSFPWLNNVLNGLISFAFGLLMAGVYHIYSKRTIEQVASAAAEKISPIIEVTKTIPELQIYATAMKRKFKYAFVLRHVIRDHLALMREDNFLMSFDSYLGLLQSFSSRYSLLKCINLTPPIFWMAPEESLQRSTINYELQLRKKINLNGFRVQRMTLVPGHENIFEQFQRAYARITRKADDTRSIISWILGLFHYLYAIAEWNDALQIVAQCFPEHHKQLLERNLTKPFNPQISQVLTKDLPSSELSGIIKNFEKLFVADSVISTRINKIIYETFVKIHRREGSYYITREFYRNQIPYQIANEYGEIGIYLEDGEPAMAIATRGGTWVDEVVSLKIISDVRELNKMIDDCLKLANEISSGKSIGNFEDLSWPDYNPV
ncbi:hypothetical protein DCC62_13810 [candidate division KSB1 bacterium]|nr:MAG: hypothetical protein DCC62_13810 [candidate division KSB1 bacterium]